MLLKNIMKGRWKLNKQSNSESMIYAISKSGWVHVSSVKSGLQCNCKCPVCNAPLIAKKGEKKKHHFAHIRNSICKAGNSDSIIYLVANILKESKKFIIPSFDFHNIIGPNNINCNIYYKHQYIEPEKVMIDLAKNGLLIKYQKNRTLFLRIITKENKFIKDKINKNYSILALNLEDIPTNTPIHILKNIVADKRDKKTWIYNKEADDYFNELLNLSYPLKIYRYKKSCSGQVFCPLKSNNQSVEVGTICFGKPCKYYFMDDWDTLYCLVKSSKIIK